MKKTGTAVLATLLLLAGLLAVPGEPAAAQRRRAPEPAGPIRHVILVSIDGLMPAAYLEPDRYGLKVPTLRRMAAEGAYSPGVRSVLPTQTYPAHASIVTGVNPREHGIVTNGLLDPREQLRGHLRWYAEDIRVPTLWDAARDRGLRTAMIYWPVTVGAQAGAIVPEFWRSDDGSAEDQKLLRAMSTPGLIEAVARRFPDFYENFRPPRVHDVASTHVAVHLIETLRPHLLLLHIFDVDHYQHSDGPLAGRGLEALERADAQLARVMDAAQRAGTWPHTALVVVSDHGFAETCRRVRPGVWLAERGLVTLDALGRVADWKAAMLPAGGMAYFYLRDPGDEETRQALLDIFRPRAGRHGSGIGRLLTAEDIRILGGDPEAALAVEAGEGFVLSGGYTGAAISDAPLGGTHGYPPDRPDMLASLLIYGPPVGVARLEGVRLIDVAPTVARWLELEFGHAGGTALEVPLRATPR